MLDLTPGPAGTKLVRNLGTGEETPPETALFQGRAAFSAETAAEGAEVWLSDGTEAGTEILADLEPGPGNGVPPVDQVLSATGSSRSERPTRSCCSEVSIPLERTRASSS